MSWYSIFRLQTLILSWCFAIPNCIPHVFRLFHASRSSFWQPGESRFGGERLRQPHCSHPKCQKARSEGSSGSGCVRRAAVSARHKIFFKLTTYNSIQQLITCQEILKVFIQIRCHDVFISECGHQLCFGMKPAGSGCHQPIWHWHGSWTCTGEEGHEEKSTCHSQQKCEDRGLCMPPVPMFSDR